MKKDFPKQGSRVYWVGRLHKEFVDHMHSYFGLNSPEYAVIVFEDRSFALACMKYGDFGGPILLPNERVPEEFDSYYDYVDFGFTVYHESAHILHRGVTKFTEDSIENRGLLELVANMGALLFIKEKKGEDMFQY